MLSGASPSDLWACALVSFLTGTLAKTAYTVGGMQHT
jgi:hypothetical protein